MFVGAGRQDSEILRSKEVRKMRTEYTRRFGEFFPVFNYIDFHRDGEKCAAQVYKERLAKALEDNEPYHLVSKWVHVDELLKDEPPGPKRKS